MNEAVRNAYAARAIEYTEVLGSMGAVHAEDRRLVVDWASRVKGPIVDAGCGPGHWTHFLADLGADVAGVDQVPEFIEQARMRFPGIRFHEGSLEALPVEDASVGGVLAWYSLIHYGPGALHIPLRECARVLKPGGLLLTGFFAGPRVEPFDHAVFTAFRWPVQELAAELSRAGFELVETHQRTDAGHRPHGAILARRKRSRIPAADPAEDGGSVGS